MRWRLRQEQLSARWHLRVALEPVPSPLPELRPPSCAPSIAGSLPEYELASFLSSWASPSILGPLQSGRLCSIPDLGPGPGLALCRANPGLARLSLCLLHP